MTIDDRALLTNLTLARTGLDRAAHIRLDPQAWADVLAHPSTRAVLLHGHRAAVLAHEPTRLVRVPLTDVAWPHVPVLLGTDDDGAVVGALISREVEVDIADVGWGDLRELGARLDDADAGLMVTAVALTQWHQSHSHCPTCGRAVTVGNAGWAGLCDEHGEQHPRTDPAVIVLVRDADDRALLGRRSEWADGWYSTLAGFVEAGESAEQTVAREVLEESAVVVDPTTLVYLGSQPWPFPRSLMLGYHAFTSAPETATPDGDEISEVRWFTRSELAEGCAAGTVRIPPRVSVARRLIERWYGEELPGEWSRP